MPTSNCIFSRPFACFFAEESERRGTIKRTRGRRKKKVECYFSMKLFSFDYSRMFPHLQLNIAGLQENLNYCIVVEIVVASGHRHKHCGSNANDENMNRIGGWTKAGQAEQQPTIEERIYVHPESPASGAHWMQHMVSFNKLKLTNNNTKRGSNVRIHVFLRRFARPVSFSEFLLTIKNVITM